MEIGDQAFILVVLLFLSAFFSGVETAFFSLSDIRLQHLLEQGHKGIERVMELKSNNERLIITILIGNNVVNIAASSFATSLAIRVFESNAVGITVGVMTLTILIFGEIIPKSIALRNNEWIATAAAPVIRSMQYVFFPVLKILELLTVGVSDAFGTDTADRIITEAEIKTVVDLGEEAGEVEADERMMIHNIFRFSDLTVSEIMLDRTQIFSIDAEADIRTSAPAVVQKGFSRIPICEGNIDNVKGILYAKDILQALLADDVDKPVKSISRPCMFIPETMLVDDLLREFQKAKVHMAIVVDEHGGVSGLITIEDLIEEIVGEIFDETDREKVMIRQVDKEKSFVRGETEIEEVNRALNLKISEREDYETISGFILAQLRRIPAVGEELKIGKHLIRVTKADQKRIIEVEIIRGQKLAEGEEEGEEAPDPA